MRVVWANNINSQENFLVIGQWPGNKEIAFQTFCDHEKTLCWGRQTVNRQGVDQALVNGMGLFHIGGESVLVVLIGKPVPRRLTASERS
jgi:hypothetical protein